MRIRTILGILFGVALVLAALYLTQANLPLLDEPFRVLPGRTVPLGWVLLAAFALGAVPGIGALAANALRRELDRRRRRRERREDRSIEASLRRGLDLLSDGQWSRAAEELEGVLADRPEEFSALLAHGEALRRAGRAEEAATVHRRASELYPQSAAVHYQLAADHEAAGRPEAARETRDRMLRDVPGFGLEILRRRRDAAVGAGDWRRAAELQERLEALLQEAGEPSLEPEAALRRALAYEAARERLDAGDARAAADALAELTKEAPTFVPAAVALGDAHAALDRPDRAVDAWRRAWRRTGHPVFLDCLVEHHVDAGDPPAAIDTLRELAAEAEDPDPDRKAPDDLFPRFFLGRLYHRFGMHQDALDTLEPLAPRLAVAPAYHLTLAAVHRARGDTARAAEELTEGLAEAGLAAADYRCRLCRDPAPEWLARCPSCGAWSSLELDLERAEESNS